MIFFWGGDPATSTTTYTLDTYGASPPPYWHPKYATDVHVRYDTIVCI